MIAWGLTAVAAADKPSDAAYIATMSPPVALAMAEMFDSVLRTDDSRSQDETHQFCDGDCDMMRAANVADAVLGVREVTA